MSLKVNAPILIQVFSPGLLSFRPVNLEYNPRSDSAMGAMAKELGSMYAKA